MFPSGSKAAVGCAAMFFSAPVAGSLNVSDTTEPILFGTASAPAHTTLELSQAAIQP